MLSYGVVCNPMRGDVVSGQLRVENEFVILDPSPGCESCWGCSRVCPTRAIRVTISHTEVIRERCVKCGACVSVCGVAGMRVRDDLDRVRDLIDSDRRVIALLATESIAALHPLSAAQMDSACRSAGFFAVESTFLGEEAVAREYEQLSADRGDSLLLRSTCPVAVEWVRKYRPSLTSALAPIVPPYIAQARLIRATYGQDVAIVYVSPCYARKDECATTGLADAVDVAIGFDELKRLLHDYSAPTAGKGDATADPPSLPSFPAKDISATDGFPRSFLDRKSGSRGDIVVVRGIEAIDRLLGAIESGVARPGVVDMLYCESCIDGPAMGVTLSGYERRALRPIFVPASVSPVTSRQLLAHLPQVEMSRSLRPAPVLQQVFAEDRIDAALMEGGFASREEVIDCGACGYPTCVEHASAVLAETSTWDVCVPMQIRRLEERVVDLTESATVDSLTALWNRRVFSDRLAHEFARFRRYGLPFSLLMVDLDAFKSINDTYGHTTGDLVLRDVAQAMKGVLRETDIASRYGGDEFAIILPGIDKTAAYAVAEKLRAAVSRLEFAIGHPSSGETISVTLSVGLAAASPAMVTHGDLLEHADRALYRAKEQGRDRVRLAPHEGS